LSPAADRPESNLSGRWNITPTSFLTNLAIVLCVAAVTTVVFQRLKQPVVLATSSQACWSGPHVPFPLVADSDTIHGLSELGVILLLFTIGWNSPSKSCCGSAHRPESSPWWRSAS